MFGRRRREDPAIEAAREAERRALFAKLSERPEHICPFLGLADDRAGYVHGVSDDHRCYAFGDPATLSAEQQTRVCQERGYGNCPRYLRGVLVIPTEELEALRRPRAAEPLPPPAPPAAESRRRGVPVLLLVLILAVLAGGGAAAFFLLGDPSGVANATPTPVAPPATASVAASVSPSATAEPTAEPTPPPTAEPTPNASALATPTPEPTPDTGDAFAFYEVSVGPATFVLYSLDEAGAVVDSSESTFGAYSFARVEPTEGADGNVYWVTQEGGLEGWSYAYPDSGEFRIRAVFLSPAGERRSVYLEQAELDDLPEATPAP